MVVEQTVSSTTTNALETRLCPVLDAWWEESHTARHHWWEDSWWEESHTAHTAHHHWWEEESLLVITVIIIVVGARHID